MELKLWHTIVSSGGQVRSLLDRALPDAAEAQARSSDATIVVSQPVAVLKTLRDDIRTRLDELRGDLAKVLSEREVYQVLFPLTIHYDELVLRRLSPTEQTAWPLLQSERYGINDGGDVFYSFADDRLANAETPPLVFEVLYFCLSAGFVGKFGNDGGKVQRYKALLTERIPGAQMDRKKKRRRREREVEESAPAASPAPATVESVRRLRSVGWYYALALGAFFLAVGGVLLLTNL